MNAHDILHYGHQSVLGALADLPEAAWHAPGACGVWSVKDILAHLTSYEQVLADVLRAAQRQGPTPHLDRMRDLADDFNDTEVAQRYAMTVAEVLAEFNAAHEAALAALATLAAETLRANGTMPWYGEEYALDDFIVYTNYGHKREHAAQIAGVKDRWSM